MKVLLASALLLVGLAGCTTPAPPRPKALPANPTSAPVREVVHPSLSAVGLDPKALDRKADPCEDFYQFACGNWIAQTKIPADRARWVRSFSEIHKRNEGDLRAILDAAAKSKGDGAQGKLGAFYRACLDDKAVEKVRLAPLAPLLRRIRRVSDAASLRALVAELHLQQVWVLFSINGDQDQGDTSRNIVHLDQDGLGLPDRDYYVKQGSAAKKLREGYRAHVARMLRLTGWSQRGAERAAGEVMALETQLAKLSKTRVERRNARKMYNKIDGKTLKRGTPHFAWQRYFEALGLGSIDVLDVSSPKFFRGLDKLLADTKPSVWRSYLTWHLLHAYASQLAKPFADEAFALQKLLTGQKTQRPRWKRCIAATDDALGELLAQPFVDKRFAGERKGVVTKMVHAISAAFGEVLEKLPWMDAATREKAHEKRKAMAFLIGYPDHWRRYDFAVGKAHLANVRAARSFELRRRLARVGKPVDLREWEMSPPTVNAYYQPTKNHMVFPAGILQPPFYDHRAAVAVNMGAMGMVVGHELTHGFDDEGSTFDARGNLRNWWAPTVRQAFEKRTRCMVKQYSGYEPLPKVKLDGELTLGENIADAGGVKLAYRAYRALRRGKPRLRAEGFDEDQLFFLSVGQIWCARARDSLTKLRARTDPHSAPRFRVNGSLTNSPEFAQAFHCKAGTAMAPVKRCEVW